MDDLNFGDQFSLISKISSQYRDWRKGQEKDISTRTLALLIGSGVALPHKGDPGIPGPNQIVDLIRKEFDSGEELDKFNEKVESLGASNLYQSAMAALIEYRGQDNVNTIIRTAVCQALNKRGKTHPHFSIVQNIGDFQKCINFEKNVHLWHLNPGVKALGEILAGFNDYCGKTVLTTNFDPLIEVATRNAKGHVDRVILDADGRFDKHFNDSSRVIHLHGYWHTADTLHTQIQLKKPRIRLQASLRRSLTKKTLLVLGYGGWDDILMKSLRELVEEEDQGVEVIWAFYEKSKADILEWYPHIFKSLESGIARGRIQFYKGIDSNLFLPALAVKLEDQKSRRTKRKVTVNVTNDPKKSGSVLPDADSLSNNIFFELEPNISIEAIIKKFRSNLTLSELPSFNNAKKGVGFTLFEGRDASLGATVHFLSLHSDANLLQTAKLFKQKYPDLGHAVSLFVLFPKQKGHSKFEIRRNAVARNFDGIHTRIYYIDEFLWEYCMPDRFKQNHPLNLISNFVEPQIKPTGKEKALERITKWQQVNDSPLLIIKGGGGMGKTTVARKFLERIHKDSVVGIFIDVYDVIDQIHSILNDKGKFDLYDFYFAHVSLNPQPDNQSATLDRELFKLSLDYGKIVIVLDGLEEILVRLGNKFDINSFFNSFRAYSDDHRKAKIIVTVRDYFWDRSIINLDYELLELLPFNSDLSREFFRSHFPAEGEKQAELGLKVAREIMGRYDSNEIPPFVLDIVKYIISKPDYEAIELDRDFFSDILSKEILQDYIIYKICSGEERKQIKKGIPIDDQVRIFNQIVNEPNAIVSGAKLKDIITEESSVPIGEESIDFFKSHPMIKILDPSNGELITLRYDFLKVHFVGIQLGGLIKGKKALSENLIKELGLAFTYNSTFTQNYLVRSVIKGDKLKLGLVNMLEAIREFPLAHPQADRLVKKAISGVLTLGLTALKINEKLNPTNTRELIRDLFETNGVIEGMSLFNLTRSEYGTRRVLFDFTGLKFRNCTIVNYEAFYDSLFSEDTFFEDCNFERLGNYYAKSSANRRNFHPSCTFENASRRQIGDAMTSDKEVYEVSRDYLFEFIKLFYGQGNFQHKSLVEIRKGWDSGNEKLLSGKQIISLMDENLIFRNTDGNVAERKFKILENHVQDVRNFFSRGTPSTVISTCINLIYDELYPFIQEKENL